MHDQNLLKAIERNKIGYKLRTKLVLTLLILFFSSFYFSLFFEGKFRKTDLELIGQQFSMHDIKKVIKKISKSDGFNISEIFDPLLV